MTFATQRKRGHHAFIVLMVALLTLMPTYTALAEIHATPVVEPTPQPSPMEEAVNSTLGPEGTPDFDIEVQPTDMIGPMEVSVTSSMRCSDPGSEWVLGNTVVINCDATFEIN